MASISSTTSSFSSLIVIIRVAGVYILSSAHRLFSSKYIKQSFLKEIRFLFFLRFLTTFISEHKRGQLYFHLFELYGRPDPNYFYSMVDLDPVNLYPDQSTTPLNSLHSNLETAQVE